MTVEKVKVKEEIKARMSGFRPSGLLDVRSIFPRQQYNNMKRRLGECVRINFLDRFRGAGQS